MKFISYREIIGNGDLAKAIDRLKPLPNIWLENEDGKKFIPGDKMEVYDIQEKQKEYPYMNFRSPELRETIFKGDKELMSGSTTINLIQPIVMYLVQNNGWDMVEAITVAATTCGRCLNILLEETTGEPYEERDTANTYCELCDTIDPEYAKEYKAKEKVRTASVDDKRKRVRAILEAAVKIGWLKIAFLSYREKIRKAESLAVKWTEKDIRLVDLRNETAYIYVDDFEGFKEALGAAPSDLQRGEGGRAAGVFMSFTPRYWVSRLKGKWDVFKDFTEGQRNVLSDHIERELESLKEHKMLTSSEIEYAERNLRRYRDGTYDYTILPTFTNLPYGIKIADNEVLKGLGLPGTTPTEAHELKLTGKFADMTRYGHVLDAYPQDVIDLIKFMGGSGMFTEAGWQTMPEVVVWDKNAISFPEKIEIAILSYREEMEKKARLDINMVRRFYEQESKRGVVDDKILNNLQMDLIAIFKDMRDVQEKFLWIMKRYDVTRDSATDMFEEMFPDLARRFGSGIYALHYSPEDAENTIRRLESAKTDQEKILSINEALNQAHYEGNVLGKEYDELRKEMEKRGEGGGFLKEALGPADFYSFYALSLVPPDYWRENPYHAEQAAELLNGMWKAYAPKIEYGIAGEIYNAYKRHAIDYEEYLEVVQRKNWADAIGMFEDPSIWDGMLQGYGGPKWADITKLYGEMADAFPVSGSNLPEGFILIDRLHDIEHNTDLVLSEHYEWIDEALEHKRTADPKDVMNRATDRYRHIVMESGVGRKACVNFLSHREAVAGERRE